MTASTAQHDRQSPGAHVLARRGFTLLELVLIMLVISTVMALAAPSLRNFWRAAEARDAAVDLMSVTRWAREKAAANGTIYRLIINPQNSTYQLWVLDGENFVEVTGSFGNIVSMPRDGRIELIEPRDRTHLDFFPDGRSDPATIRLTDGVEDIIVECSSPSELYRILPAEEKRLR